MSRALGIALHLSLSAGFVLVAALCVPAARVGLLRPVLWAIESHEYHLRRALALMRGEV